MTCISSTCSWMMWTTLYEICMILHSLKQIMLIYLACKHIHCAHFVQCTVFISTYTSASYMIANRESSRSTRGTRGAARGVASRGDRSRRRGRWRTSRVPWSPSELLRERQATEHFSPPRLQLLISALLKWCITFRSCLQLLLHYTLFTLIILYPCYPGIRSQVNA
jgi:hypothetical protein